MGTLHEMRHQLLCDGKITTQEVRVLREYIERDGKLDAQDVRLLVELLCDAREVCTEFDDLFFPILQRVILEDGRVTPDERYYLLKMLYSDGCVRPRERELLAQLQRGLEQQCPEFTAMCETARTAPDSHWHVEGVETVSRRPR